MKYLIKKAKLTKGRTLEVELTEINDDNTENEVTKKCSQLVHDDLINAMDKLKFHLAHMCDTKESDSCTEYEADNVQALDRIKITSFSVSGSADNEGVCLVGSRKIGQKVLNLISPFTEYENEDDQYQFGQELAIDIEALKHEVNEYLFNGKYAIKQLEIPFDKEPGDPDDFEHEKEFDEVGKAVLGHMAEIINPKKGKGKKGVTVDFIPHPNFAVGAEMQQAEQF